MEKVSTAKDSVFEGFLSLDGVWALPRPRVQLQGGKGRAGIQAPHPLSCIPMATAPLTNPSPPATSKGIQAPAKIPSSGQQKSYFPSFTVSSH